MSAPDSASQTLLDALGVSEVTDSAIDPIGLGSSLAKALAGAARRPVRSIPVGMRLVRDVAGASVSACVRFVRPPGTDDGPRPDARFADPAWRENPFFWAMHQWHTAAARFLDGLVGAADLDATTADRAHFTAGLVAAATAPTNLALTNPAVLKRALETGGISLIRGQRNFVRDVVGNGGWPRQVDRGALRVGKDLAVTPGKVVYRNSLIELIQYEPKTAATREVPLLACPPWINRYYIADLAPGRSLVEWALTHQQTTFAISYRNPDESMRDITFDDYLRLGPLTAIDIVREISGVDSVNLVAICLGGTLQAALLAYLDAVGDQLVRTATFLNSAIDYGHEGVLARVFAVPGTIATLSRQGERKGYVEAEDMAHTFDLLRANDLVFRYVVDGWLLGKDPPVFDLLAWNADGMRIPVKAHTYFLDQLYQQNALAQDQMEVLGERLVVSGIKTDTYVVAAVDDHIVPWRASYRTTQLFKGPMRFVLTSAGHIAGIVNPPHPKTRMWTNDDLPAEPEEWNAGATEHLDTWWNDWITWLDERSGELVPARSAGTEQYPALASAPGTYVLG
jgi:polyhydroxyalkanoate synthase subunit PhaC